MKLRAKDTVLITSVKNEKLLPGEGFEMDDETVARSLIDRGIAEEDDGNPGKPAKPAKPGKPAPENKGSVETEKKD